MEAVILALTKVITDPVALILLLFNVGQFVLQREQTKAQREDAEAARRSTDALTTVITNLRIDLAHSGRRNGYKGDAQ
jgi:hypothetical protein